MHLLQYICMSVRVFVCLSLLSFHFTLQSLTQKWKIFLSLIKSVNLSHLVWEKCDHQLSLCSASNFLTLSIPFHIELLDKFVHVTPWELREQSAWWVTWNFFVVQKDIFASLDQWVSLCPSVWKHLWSPILIMRRPRKLLRNVVCHWLVGMPVCSKRQWVISRILRR